MIKIGSAVTFIVIATLCVSLSGAALAGGGGATIAPRAGLKWAPGAAPEVSTCAVEGDMAKGPSHFYLRYAAGFAAPLHHHSTDHYVTTVSGTLVLTVDGKEHRLPPGSFFALTGKKAHETRCEAGEDCVMFLDARGPWDVVMADQKAKQP